VAIDACEALGRESRLDRFDLDLELGHAATPS
jgi:hypothetical protein